MAGATGHDRAAVTATARALAAQARRTALFQALRLLDVDPAGRERDHPVRIHHVPHLHHSGADLTAVRVEDDAIVIESNVLGLLGPNGPMPLRLTEEAVWQLRRRQRSPLGDFLSLLGERQLLWFYQAWTLGRVEHGHGRRDHGFLQAAASSAAAAPELDPRDLGLLGLWLNAPRSSAALESLIAALTGCRTHLVQFVGEWLRIAPQDRCLLGRASLGRNATIGSRVWQKSTAFRINLQVRSWAEYLALVPRRSARALRLDRYVARFLTVGLKWHYALTLPSEQVEPARLGSTGRLGETAWIGRPGGVAATVLFASPTTQRSSFEVKP